MSLPSPRRQTSPLTRNRPSPRPPVWSAEVREAIECLLCIKGIEYKTTHPDFQTPSVDEFFGVAAAAARGVALPRALDAFATYLCTKHYSKCPLQKIGVLLVYALALRGGTTALLAGDGVMHPATYLAHGVDWFLANVVPALQRKRERLLRACETSAQLIYTRAASAAPASASAGAAFQAMDAAITDLLSKGALPLR